MNQESVFRDDDKFIVTFTSEHLNKKIAGHLKLDKVSIYEISWSDITQPYREIGEYWMNKGYSVLFADGKRTKILKYN